MSEPRKPLSGIRVLDFSMVMAGPYCTRVLAGLGADVVKVEPPSGDPIRRVEPIRQGHSAYFAALNAGKRGVVLDLKRPDHLAAARDLAVAADVVVESFRVGVMARYGLGYEALAERNPALVYCSISGFGQTGPDAGRPATAQVVHAISGFDAALAAYQPDPAVMPVTGVFVADGLAGALAVSAVLAALRTRDQTGVGGHVDVPLEDALLSILIHEVQAAQFPTAQPRGYRPARTADGHIMISAINPKTFQALCRAIGRPDLQDDERFSDPVQRRRNLAKFQGIIEEWSRARPGRECEELLHAAGVPAARYQTVSERLVDSGLCERGTTARARDAAGELSIVNVPFTWQARPSASGAREAAGPLPVPGLGENTQAVLAELLGPQRARSLR